MTHPPELGRAVERHFSFERGDRSRAKALNSVDGRLTPEPAYDVCRAHATDGESIGMRAE